MKFSCSVDIDKTLNKVVDVFLNPDNLKHYQDGFIEKRLISGSAGKKGSKSKMIYKKLELIETIINNDLPEEFYALYEHKHMTNTMKVSFKSLDENKTRYISEIEYTKFNGLFIKMMAKLFPGLFKKQVQKWLNQFKSFVETIE
ncbi:SRPBCC family protein [uncultured Lacinutrix sp.]|uniref:SRPBCC family protein n=1 Tax=uncultured Lacinutrix sp. TaxID=574032 RepID=UPI00260A83BC|nr:SRPBCC family protein [uncultured Lacinutrix sp.]